MRKKTAISLILLFLWIILIFYFSSQVADDSNQLSKGIMNTIVDFIERIFPSVSFDFSNFNYFIRKSAHFITYFILGLLTINAFRNLGLRNHKLVFYALLFCFLYAILDEFHQSYIPGRSGQVSDVLLDSSGALIGILVYLLIKLNFKTILGQFQKNIMIFGVNRKYLASSVGAFIGLVATAQAKFIDGSLSELSSNTAILAVVGSVLLGIFTFVVETKKYMECQSELFELDIRDYRTMVIDKICLSQKYIDNDYEIGSHGNERYVMSQKVNRLLYDKADRIPIQVTGQFLLSEEMKTLVPFAIRTAFGQKNFLYNSKLVRLVDDFFTEDVVKKSL